MRLINRGNQQSPLARQACAGCARYQGKLPDNELSIFKPGLVYSSDR